MAELNRMINEVREWRAFHRARYNAGVKGASIEAAACAIRETALLDARAAVLAESAGVEPARP